MTQIDLSKYKDLYISTAREYIIKLRESVPTLAQNTKNANLIEDMHIAAHSLKGQSLAMGYTSVGDVSMLLEHIFRDAKQNPSILSDELLKKMEQAVGVLEDAITMIEKDGHELDVSSLTDQLRTIYPNT